METWKPRRDRELAIRSAENSFGTPQTFNRSSSKSERRSLRESESESSAWKSFSIEFDRREASCYIKRGNWRNQRDDVDGAEEGGERGGIETPGLLAENAEIKRVENGGGEERALHVMRER